MNQFINCLLGLEQLPEWDDIYSEYIGMRENKSSSILLDLIKEIGHLKTKQYIIITCIKVLTTKYVRELAIELKQSGCRGKFDWSEPAQYSADLKAANSYAKTYNNKIARKEKELEEYNTKHGGQQLDRKFFEDLAATLGTYCHQYLDFDVVTASRFCAIWNQYDRYCEVKNAQTNNLLNKGADVTG